MLILQLLNDASTLDFGTIIGAGTGGGVITIVVQAWLNRNKDKTDVITNQVNMLNQVNQNLNEVVTKLQDLACYREKCKTRLNGEDT
jgi:tRNA(Met) C34 N-acetyltransferase TmcA